MSLDRFRPGVEEALAHGGDTHSVEDMAELILSGRAQLWVQRDALIVTEIRDYPQKRVLRFWLATGDLEDCIALHRHIMEWGREKGCNLAIITGRRGWIKPLRSEGWTEAMSVLTQEL